MRVPLPDGSVRELPDGSTGADLAADIGPGLARAALAIRVLSDGRTEKADGTAYDQGRIRDLSAPLNDGEPVEIVTT
ncbi:MAG TPA: TGS domain-containing protein, partial [Solirubrobacter sp.]|nr:TGS domain-containing protein [Solirubrobacter sp.]